MTNKPNNSNQAPKAPRKKAVALRYDAKESGAPLVVAKGQGTIAEKLLELARQHGVPIHEDADLTEVLSQLNLNEEIPAETYLLVAEVLAFIYRTNSSMNS